MKALVFLPMAFILFLSTPAMALAPGKLFKIPSSSIGPTIRTVTGSGNTLKTITSIAASGAFTSSAGRLGANLIARTPWGAAGALALGYLYYSDIDMEKAYNNGTLWQFPAISDFLNDYYQPSSSTPSVGDTLSPNSFIDPDTAVSSGCSSHTGGFTVTSIVGPEYPVTGGGHQPAPTIVTCGDTAITYKKLIHVENLWYTQTKYNGYWGSNPITFPSGGAPASLDQAQASALGQAIANALTPALQSALESLLQAHPDLVEQPDQISNSDAQNWATENNYTSNQDYIDYLTNQYNNYEGDTATQQYYQDLIEEAKEDQADEEEDEAEDTFSPIADNPFANPYSPGEFDIPSRFTTFLSNVKSSGLFSFSSSFFNSLPGGGSPVYEIEAGQYGHHSIDLSQTLSTGLAVLKTVLMLCFGFLSIRAVIMKR